MMTDDFVRALAADTLPARPLVLTALLGLVPALTLAAIVVWATLGFRVDLLQAIFVPVSAARFVLTGVLAVCALRIAVVLSRPQGQSLAQLGPLVAIGIMALGLWYWAFVTTPAEGLQMAVVGKTVSVCLVAIPILSILPTLSVLAMLRHGACTAPRLASAMAGLAGSGAAAAVYALHCTEDNPLFFVTWYGLAIAMVTAATTIIGPRYLRW